MPVIDVKELSHTYLSGTPLEVRSLDKVNMKVFINEIVGIIGPSGSGKSTLLQHLNGLLVPQNGDLYINGTSISELSSRIREVRQSIGLVFQNPEKQLFEHYAGDDVAFGPRNMGLTREEIRKRVRAAMETVGLPFAYKDRLTAELSLGEKRRLALAGVLAMEPRVLVLDEPTSSLDPEGRSELLDILSRWKMGTGKALVIASHNMEDIAELSNRVYVLVEGRVVASGSAKEVFAGHDILARHGLSAPLPAQIILELVKQGLPVSPDVLTEDETVEEIRSLLNAGK
ncbi:MAG TPA: energy-coupling factor transporter ATPase [Spirochaetes bacterium]|nr:energy-coupling factor transporter ATPase [Spirochaetota bacterium]